LSDAATAAFECDDALTSPNNAGVTTAAPAARSSMSPWRIAASFIVGAMLTAMIAWARWPLPALVPASSRFALELPSDHLLTRAGRHVVALSPDGMTLAYIANRQIFLHSFRDLTTTAINGTVGADPSEPVFSPDGTWIAYWSDGTLKKIPMGGGTAARLADVGNPLGLSWIDERIIVGQSRSILEVPANGGSSKTLVSIDQTADDWVQSPQLIDDGRAVLFTLRTEGDWNNADIVVQDLASAQRTALVHGGTDGHILPGGLLVYARENALFAVRVDEKTRATSGPTIPLEHDVLPSLGGFTGASQMAWSPAGIMAYVVDSTAAEMPLSWFTRDGKATQTALPARNYYPASRSLELSPDGTRVAVRIVGALRSQSDVWVGDIARGTFTRLSTTGKATDPVWTPDGTRVCFREIPTGVLCRASDGSAPSQLLFQLDHLSTVLGFTSDREHVLLAMNAPNGTSDISMVANRPPFKEQPLFSTPAKEVLASVSPDGHWIAYQSDESGQDQVYVTRFPNVGEARWQVSATGGNAPRWSRDSRELYYLALETGGTALRSTLTRVPVHPGATFTTGPATSIATLPSSIAAYDVAPDGRFLLNIAAATPTGLGGTRQSLVVVQNWLGELRSRAQETKR
jgi:Tol biopolymer transport system component